MLPTRHSTPPPCAAISPLNDLSAAVAGIVDPEALWRARSLLTCDADGPDGDDFKGNKYHVIS